MQSYMSCYHSQLDSRSKIPAAIFWQYKFVINKYPFSFTISFFFDIQQGYYDQTSAKSGVIKEAPDVEQALWQWVFAVYDSLSDPILLLLVATTRETNLGY